MKIENLKDLQKVIKACRAANITHIKLGDLELTLGPAPKAVAASPVDYNVDPLADAQVPVYRPIETLPVHQETAQETASRLMKEEGLTDEQMLHWSAVGPTDHLIGEQ